MLPQQPSLAVGGGDVDSDGYLRFTYQLCEKNGNHHDMKLLLATGLLTLAVLAGPVGATIYNVNDEAHFPDFTMPCDGCNSADNPLAGNVWEYGFRETGAGNAGNDPVWNNNAFQEFIHFDKTWEMGANVIGGAASWGDINGWCQDNGVGCDAGGNLGGQVRIVDFGSGAGTHTVAGVDSYVKGTVHLYTDDDAPTDRASIVRFNPPEAGTYQVSMLFENRAYSGQATDGATYHAVHTSDNGFFENFTVLSEGQLGPQSFNGSQGLGSGAYAIVEESVTLAAGDYIELAAMGSGLAWPGVPVALNGTIECTGGACLGGGGDGPSGDYNGDGQIDAADYTVYQDTVGQAVTAGSGADGNANGTIDQGDYIFWSDRFGNAAGSGGAAAVPEPSSLVLLPLLFAGLASVRRRAA